MEKTIIRRKQRGVPGDWNIAGALSETSEEKKARLTAAGRGQEICIMMMY